MFFWKHVRSAFKGWNDAFRFKQKENKNGGFSRYQFYVGRHFFISVFLLLREVVPRISSTWGFFSTQVLKMLDAPGVGIIIITNKKKNN